MDCPVIIRISHRYVRGKALTCEAPFASLENAPTREITMRKTIFTILGSALVVASVAQIATAAEHKSRKAVRAPAPVSEPVRNSNAYAWPSQADGYSRYQNGAMSAPAGR